MLFRSDLLEMEVRMMAHAKAKAKGLPCPLELLKPYAHILNGKFVKTRDSAIGEFVNQDLILRPKL